MKEEVRIAIIGYGGIGKLHYRAFSQLPGAKVVAVAEAQREKMADLPSSITKCLSYEDLSSSSFEAVSICLPTYLHHKAALHALANGKHVLLEKPIAMNRQEATEVIRAAKKTGTHLFVGMTHRFYPELREARSLVEDGVIGSLVACRDSDVCLLDLEKLPVWYLDKNKAGGGVVLTDGIHLIDRLTWFVGCDVASVGGYMGQNFQQGSIEDTALMLLKFANGLPAQVFFAWLSTPHPYQCDLQLVGTKGSITVHTWSGYELRSESGSRDKAFYTNEPRDERMLTGLVGEVREFCQSIREGRAPAPSVEETTKALDVIATFYEVANQGYLKCIGE